MGLEDQISALEALQARVGPQWPERGLSGQRGALEAIEGSRRSEVSHIGQRWRLEGRIGSLRTEVGFGVQMWALEAIVSLGGLRGQSEGRNLS